MSISNNMKYEIELEYDKLSEQVRFLSVLLEEYGFCKPVTINGKTYMYKHKDDFYKEHEHRIKDFKELLSMWETELKLGDKY